MPDSIVLIIAALFGTFIGWLTRSQVARRREHRAWISGYNDCRIFTSRKADPSARRL